LKTNQSSNSFEKAAYPRKIDKEIQHPKNPNPILKDY